MTDTVTGTESEAGEVFSLLEVEPQLAKMFCSRAVPRVVVTRVLLTPSVLSTTIVRLRRHRIVPPFVCEFPGDESM